MAKSDLSPEVAFLNLLLIGGACSLVHCLVAGVSLLSVIDAWPIMLVSATGLSLYSIAMMMTLIRGDLSVYYPIMRSSPLFIVSAGFLVLGERYSTVLLAGILIVTIGIIFIQRREGSRLFHDPVTLLTATLAMAGSGVYSIADSRAVLVIEPMVVFFWQTVLAAMVLAAYLAVFRALPPTRVISILGSGWRKRPIRFLATGMLVYLSYMLILTAYGWGGNVAAVTAVRQASIPISVLVGVFALHETELLKRLIWSLVIGIGITVIAMAR